MLYTFGAKKGSFADKAIQVTKRFVYRSSALNFLSRPIYIYNLDPGQLAYLVKAIDKTEGGSIVEVGVARGLTSVFLLEHMKRSGDTRPFYCIDTFSGFTESDIAYETANRNKSYEDYSGFTYGDRDVFQGNLSAYPNVTAIEADASQFDFSQCAPINVMLIDVDLYWPTKMALELASPHMSSPGFIMVDDCKDETIYDGANQAYAEFAKERKQISDKGAVIEY